ncbi:hypothetical protein LXT21_02780 [Myxococcus sp. K38C18041901]|uniref:hypothetical protein n=1 Tax=Myxococcus guangdongensis TaxID=2906760 RepID=UPI0020A8227B|nr:hypothetical protein [Myxococcus guangdongensis]MCP3057697.1 hypothetical protein [Myxococcus guangdongensis]
MRRRAGIGAVLLLLTGLGVHVVSTTQKGAFDSEQWKAQRGSGADKNPRVGMVVALKQHHLREGMSREDVHTLLGEPEQRRGTSEVYELGVSPVGVSYEYFIIDFDAQDRVTRFRVTRS